VRYLVPALIYERYERVRIFETTLDAPTIDQLHTLRIEFKRFRYTLEFFVDVLDASARAVIATCKTMQDHLGDLHDAEVAVHDLGEFVEEHNAEFSGVPKFMRPDISGVEAYLAAARADKDRLLATFPAAWATFTGPKVRRNLALAVAAL
jgi:CHAD domain-containing protein